jgi:signal transduction histidine kinase/ligand-binding sensor domain-containing protein
MSSRKAAKELLWALIMLWVANCVYALSPSPLSLHHFSSANKTPGESVQCIYEDELGILWLGVESTGLVKFDGKSYTVYKNDPEDSTSITSNYPVRIIEDKDGYLWVGTHNGLNRFDRHKGVFKRFLNNEADSLSLSSNTINHIVKDNSDRLWIATSNGLNIFQPETENFQRLLHNPDASIPARDNEVGALHMDQNGNIWVGTILNGLFLIPSQIYNQADFSWAISLDQYVAYENTGIQNWKTVLKDKGINAIRYLTSSDPDTLWIASQTGLYYFLTDKNEFIHYRFQKPEQKELNQTTFLSLLIDSEKKLWAGTSSDGLVIIDLKDNEVVYLNAENYSSNQLKSNAIRNLMESRHGLVWIATKFGGLHYYDKRQKTFPLLRKAENPKEGLSHEFVLSICEDSDNSIWVGTKGGGVNLYNRQKNEFTWYMADGQPGSLPANRVECIAEDKYGRLWLGTESGVVSKEKSSSSFTKHLDLHGRNLYITEDDFMWIGTSNGLFRFSLKKKELEPLPSKHDYFFDLESNIGITKVLEDRYNVLWIATNNNGLFEYHPDTDSLLNHSYDENNPFSISGNQVRAIHEDQTGRLWIGTKSDGLNLYERETGRFIQKSTPTTLPSNTVYHILEDDKGSFWMGTHNGISMYDPYGENFINFAMHHGLQGLIFEINAHAKTHDGFMLMGGAMGVNFFHPATIEYKPYEAPLIISKLEIFNNVEAIDINEFKRFELEKFSNYISFEFALLDFTKPEANLYAYQLQPFDEDWVYSGTRNFATYTNLPPGTYQFRVKGANSDEVWTTNELRIELFIPAPFWEKPWFIPVFFIIAVILFVIAWYIKIITTRRREALLKQEVDERTKDLFEAYNQLEASNQQVEKHNTALRQQRDRISRQNLELKIHRQNLELMVADRTKDLEKAKQRAEESDLLKSAFLANMSHEIRTPLNAIMGFIDLLETGDFDMEERQRMNAIIQSNSNTLLQLINDIIDISIIEANQVVIRKHPIDFHSFLDEIELHYKANRDATDKCLPILKQLPADRKDLVIHTDPGRVKQIYSNLINNAIKFTDKGSITFGYTYSPNKTNIICFVKDTGIGISEENRLKLFQRFHKIEPKSSRVHRGTGLGLSISKNLAELLGGEIWLESEPEKGSSFYFTLPLENENRTQRTIHS